MQDYAHRLRQLVTDATPRLLRLGENGSSQAAEPGKWTPREIIGHLLDSATNNHRRFVLGQVDRTLTFDGYVQDRWVSVQDYAHAPWVELVNAWSGINLVLAHVMASAPEAVRLAPHAAHNLHQIGWTPIERDTPATLDDLMRDYVDHLHHHLRQILGAEWTTATPEVDTVVLREKFTQVTTHWNPHIVASLNGQHVKVVKFSGAFVWHQHELEDELFLVHRGRFRMELRDKTLELQPGDFVVIPHGVEHRPIADEEVEVGPFEPAGTLNTGNVRNERTVTDPARLSARSAGPGAERPIDRTSPMSTHVVARFANGSLVKGVSINVDPARPSCHVRSADGVVHEVRFADLKALFFVKSLDGNPAHDEAMTVAAADPRVRGAHLIEVRFKDGERLVALANRYPPLGKLFFLVPVDPASNNIRILVNRDQLDSLEKVTSAA